MSASRKLRGSDDGPFQGGGRVEKREKETALLNKQELRGLGEDQIRSHLETVLEEFLNRSHDADRNRLIKRIKENHSGVVAVNEETGEIIATANDDHDLTKELLNKDYDSESTLIIRADEWTGNNRIR